MFACLQSFTDSNNNDSWIHERMFIVGLNIVLASHQHTDEIYHQQYSMCSFYYTNSCTNLFVNA